MTWSDTKESQSQRGVKSGNIRRLYSDMDGQRRQDLHDSGLKWREVAKKEGMELSALKRAMTRYYRRLETYPKEVQ